MSGVNSDCVTLMSPGIIIAYPSFISLFHFPIYSSVPRRDFFLCFIHFNFIVFFSQSFISFHQGQTPTALTRNASHVVLFFILSVCISSIAQVKQLFRALDFKVKAAVVVRDGILQQIVHVGTFTGATHLFSLWDSHLHLLPHIQQTSTHSALPSAVVQEFHCVVSSRLFLYCHMFPRVGWL